MTNGKSPYSKGYGEAGGSWKRRALRGFIPSSGSPSEDIDNYNFTLRQRARMLYMSSPVATSAIDTSRTKIIGVGLKPDVTLDREMLGLTQEQATAWERKAEAEFNLWAEKKENCDALGLYNFYQMEQLALKSWLMSGDVFVVIKWGERTVLNPYQLRIQLVEADRVRTPSDYGGGYVTATTGTVPKGKPGAGNKIYDGVEVDKEGRVVAYYVHNSYPGQTCLLDSKYTRVEAYGRETGLPNILAISEGERPGQYRGVPYLAKVIEPLLQIRRYTEAEVMAALIQCFFTAWIETEDPSAELPFPNEDAMDDPKGRDMDRGEPQENTNYEMGPGNIIQLKKGETVHFGNPNIPSAGFESFTKTMCRLIGAALEIPYDVLIKEFNSSYSASRGALLEAWSAFKMRREWFASSFCRPIYEWFICEAVASGRLTAPGFWSDPLSHRLWLGTEWIGPGQGQLDPLKEAKAAEVNTKNGFRSHAQTTREMGGGDFDENVRLLKQENEALADASVGGMEPGPTDPDGDSGNGRNGGDE